MKKRLSFLFLSALFLVLSYRFFGLWPFSFFAIVPFFYFINTKEKKSFFHVFLIGFFFGLFYSGLLIFLVLFQHLLILILATLICGAFFGAFGVVYVYLKGDDIFDVFIFSSLWVLFEWLRQIIFRDFDYTVIAYTTYSINFLMSFASIGGTYAVSFLVVLFNSFIGYFKINGFNKNFRKVLLLTAFGILIIFTFNKVYLNLGNKNGHEISFSSIQTNKNHLEYGEMKDKVLSLNTEMENYVYKAVGMKTEYIIYPDNPVQYILTDNSISANKYISATFNDVSTKLSKIIPQNTNFIYWADTIRKNEGDNIFDEFVFYKNGTTTNYYQKRNLHPFYDLSSNYFRNTGVINVPYEYSASKENKIVYVGDGERFGNLSCSELNYSFLARGDSLMGANIILSLGNSSVFEQGVLGSLNVVLAQYRAIETNLPFIRSDMWGPSVLINKNGIINSELKNSKTGILYGKLFVEDFPQKTIYSYWGDYFLIVLLLLYLFFVILYKCKNKQFIKV